MTQRKLRDMSGTAYCRDCKVPAVHERGPGTPLVIRHTPDCPTGSPVSPADGLAASSEGDSLTLTQEALRTART